MNSLKSFCSPPFETSLEDRLPNVVVSDSSDGVASLLILFTALSSPIIKHRSRSVAWHSTTSSPKPFLFAKSSSLVVKKHRPKVPSVSETSSKFDPETLLLNSGSGCNVPPRSTVCTADWQTFQLPDDSNPTTPLTGFTARPTASNKRD